MGWAVVQIVPPYHPEGDNTRPETNEFIHWVFDTQRDASRYKADLMLGGSKGKALIVKSVKEESWTPGDLAKKKKKGKDEEA